LDIKIGGSLKVKRHTLVITNYETRSNSKEKIEKDEQASSNPIIVREANDLEPDTRSAEAQETSENGKGIQHGAANGKSLKHYFP